LLRSPPRHRSAILAINISGITPGGNISVLGGNSQSEIAAFLAGYTAALITDDYRIGMIIPRITRMHTCLERYANGRLIIAVYAVHSII